MGAEAFQSQIAIENENKKIHAHFVSQGQRARMKKWVRGEICEIANLYWIISESSLLNFRSLYLIIIRTCHVISHRNLKVRMTKTEFPRPTQKLHFQSVINTSISLSPKHLLFQSPCSIPLDSDLLHFLIIFHYTYPNHPPCFSPWCEQVHLESVLHIATEITLLNRIWICHSFAFRSSG